MKAKIPVLLAALAVWCAAPAAAQDIAPVVAALRAAARDYDAQARFAATLPSAPDDVVYEVTLASRAASPADTFATADYLVSWQAQSPSGPVEGFSAYHDGSHYRFRNRRLQEYHAGWDAEPLRRGIQRQAQFYDLLPGAVADELERLAADTCTVISWRGPDRLKTVTTVAGCTAMEREYVLDPATRLPVKITTESSPGSLAEQTITVAYGPAPRLPDTIDEGVLSALYPDAFGRWRQSNFRVESLEGEPLPGFALPTATGERYLRGRGDAFRAPTIVALIDPTAVLARQVVEQLRQAVDQLPYNADLVLAMATTNADLAEETAPGLRPGEHLLLNAQSLARDCGAASLPVTLLVGSDGVVKNVVLGFNNELASDVLQKMALVK